MDEPTRRVAALVVAGIASGLLGAVGARVVLTQSGHLDVDPFLEWPEVAGVGLGIAFALLRPPPRLERYERLFMPVLFVLALLVSVFMFGPAAVAQQSCDVLVTVDGRAASLFETSPDDPLRIALDTEEAIRFTARTAEDIDGTVEVAVASVMPFDSLVERGGVVVYFDQVTGGEASGTLSVERTGWTGFRVSGDGYESSMVPLGLVELSVVVEEIADGTTSTVCAGTAWIRPVARPATNLSGQLGAAMFIGGLAGLAGVRVGRRRLVTQPTPKPDPVTRVGPDPQTIELAAVLDGAGKVISLASGVAKGKEYQLSLKISPSIDGRDRKRGEENRFVLFGRSSGVDVQPRISFTVGGLPVDLPVSFIPRKGGRQKIRLATLSEGRLVELDVVDLTVSESDDAVEPARSEITTAYLASAGSSTSSQRIHRDLLIAATEAEAGFVNLDMFGDRDGEPVGLAALVSTPTLLGASADVRRHFAEALAVAAAGETDLTADELRRALQPLATAGRKLHMTLLAPDTDLGVRSTEIGHWVRDGGIVQIVQNGAGLGPAAIPWVLVYDHPLLPRADGNVLCESFAHHEVDACPNWEDPEVICPSGFWGYRSIIEEPLVAVRGAIPTSPVALEGDQSLVFVDRALPGSVTAADEIDAAGITRVQDFDELKAGLVDADRLGLLHLASPFTTNPDVEERGFAVGEDVLSTMSVDALNLDWPQRPLVVLDGRSANGAATEDAFALVDALRRAGASGVVTTECPIPARFSCGPGLSVALRVAAGDPIGTVLLDLRRSLLVDHNSPLGFAYRLLGLSETSVAAGGRS